MFESLSWPSISSVEFCIGRCRTYRYRGPTVGKQSVGLWIKLPLGFFPFFIGSWWASLPWKGHLGFHTRLCSQLVYLSHLSGGVPPYCPCCIHWLRYTTLECCLRERVIHVFFYNRRNFRFAVQLPCLYLCLTQHKSHVATKLVWQVRTFSSENSMGQHQYIGNVYK